MPFNMTLNMVEGRSERLHFYTDYQRFFDPSS